MAVRKLLRTTTASLQNNPTAGPNWNGIIVDSASDTIVFGTGSSGTSTKSVVDTTSTQTLTNKTLTAPVINGAISTSTLNTYVGDGAISLVAQVAYLTKPSAGAYTIAAPGAGGIGLKITFTAGTDFAHVVTFTGSTLKDGTTGAKITWTSAAFIGSSLTICGVTATQWIVESKNLGTVA